MSPRVTNPTIFTFSSLAWHAFWFPLGSFSGLAWDLHTSAPALPSSLLFFGHVSTGCGRLRLQIRWVVTMWSVLNPNCMWTTIVESKLPEDLNFTNEFSSWEICTLLNCD